MRLQNVLWLDLLRSELPEVYSPRDKAVLHTGVDGARADRVSSARAVVVDPLHCSVSSKKHVDINLAAMKQVKIYLVAT